MARPSPKVWWWVGGAAVAVGVTGLFSWIFRAQLRSAGAAVWDEAKILAFKAAVGATSPRAVLYADAALKVGSEETMNPFVLIALMERESGSGAYLLPKGPTGTGDFIARRTQSNGTRVATDADFKSGWYRPKDSSGTPYPDPLYIPTDGRGWGFGLMQLDRNGGSAGSLHAQILADGRWADPYWSMKSAVLDHLRPDITYFVSQGLTGDDILRAALVAYNHGRANVMAYIKAGRNPDELTTGKNYSADVLARIAKLSAGFSF